jgi:hypothetical protein
MEPISARSGTSMALTCGGSTGHTLHVGHIAALALVKAHQHRALLVHMAHRQARPVAVAPGRPFDRAQDVSALTLPRCHRLSSSTRCLMATWAAGCRCCILQPPQAPACRPKCGQPGAPAATTHGGWPSAACSQLFFLRWTLALTSSNGSAPSMNTTLPSGKVRRATGALRHRCPARPLHAASQGSSTRRQPACGPCACATPAHCRSITGTTAPSAPGVSRDHPVRAEGFLVAP